MDAAILADNTTAVFEQCERQLNRRLPEVPRISDQAPEALKRDSKGTITVASEGKISLCVTACDGPLECHAIQGHFHRKICVCAGDVCRGNAPRQRELEDWLVVVLETIMNCIDGKEGSIVEDRTISEEQLRCAIFLLQLLSTILKSERGASHPERSNHTSALGLTDLPSGSTNDETCCGWEKVAAQACARVSNAYLGRMVRAATTLMLEDLNEATNNDHIAGNLGGADAGFWVFSILSDVLKCLRKGNWSFEDPSSRKRLSKRKRVDTTRGAEVASPALPSTAAVVLGTVDASNDDDHGPFSPAALEHLDIPALVKMVAAFPVRREPGTMDVTLKWLEVTQLLMEATETRWLSVLGDMLCSIMPAIWRLAQTGPLLFQEEPSRSPGSAFVEIRGADGALEQAILSLVFRIVRLEDRRGPLVAAGLVRTGCANNSKDRTEKHERGDIGQGGKPQTKQPWSTAVEALTAIATASAGDEESRLGYAGRLVQLFSDQDDALVDMLLTNLYIFHNTRSAKDKPEKECDMHSSNCPPALRSLYYGVLHPGTLFAALLSEVRFDSGVLLDWLISPETSFLRYLTLLLRLAVAEWPDFASRVSCTRVVALENAVDICVDVEDDEELVLSEEEGDRLSKAMSCLSGLVASARRLEKNGLMPYNLAPLLRRIDQVIMLYEDCGDAQQGEEE